MLTAFELELVDCAGSNFTQKSICTEGEMQIGMFRMHAQKRCNSMVTGLCTSAACAAKQTHRLAGHTCMLKR